MRTPERVLNLLLVAALLGFAIWAWPRLPETIPLHFGADGLPDRWGPKSLVNWFVLPAIVVAMNGLLIGAGVWMRKSPRTVNLPGGQRLEDLPPRTREAVLAMMGRFLGIVQAGMNLVFLIVQVGQYQSATAGAAAQGILQGVLILSMASGPLLLVVYFVKLQRALAVR